jgi:hypothetical protein
MLVSMKDLPPPVLPHSFPVTLTIIIHSVDNLSFLTDLGTQQIAISILFPNHSLDTISPLLPPSSTIPFNFSEDYSLNFYPHSTVNALLSSPLEFYLYLCTSDMKKQLQIARFILDRKSTRLNSSHS